MLDFNVGDADEISRYLAGRLRRDCLLVTCRGVTCQMWHSGCSSTPATTHAFLGRAVRALSVAALAHVCVLVSIRSLRRALAGFLFPGLGALPTLQS